MVESIIVVGARCAGAPLAQLLARAGRRVTVLDAGAPGSDQPLSTHFIQPYGVRVLDELGLGDRVRELAPSIDRLIHGLDDAKVEIAFPPGRGGSCPRRADLDAILVEGARAAGADLRFGWRVIDVLRDRGRVVGVIARAGERVAELRADLVVGADGRNSTIARAVAAEIYDEYPAPRFAFWAYWPRPAWFATDPTYRGAGAILHRGTTAYYAFPVNRDQLLVGIAAPVTDRAAWRAEPGAPIERLIRWTRREPYLAPLVAAPPLGGIVGITAATFFFRQAAGPGWALVGDAALFKDPLPAFGISDALRDARALARAILAGGGDRELAAYWRERDVAAVELFHYAKDAGAVGYNNPLNRLVFAHVAGRAEYSARFLEVFERTRSPFALVSRAQVLRWAARAVARGRFEVLPPLWAAVKRRRWVRKARAGRVGLATAAAVAPAQPEDVREHARGVDAR